MTWPFSGNPPEPGWLPDLTTSDPTPLSSHRIDWIWCLSGGGAKGAFQVGAALFLSTQGQFNPVGICATSVGSINALALAEGAFPGAAKLRDVWCSLEINTEMYAPPPWQDQLRAVGGPFEDFDIMSLTSSGSATFQTEFFGAESAAWLGLVHGLAAPLLTAPFFALFGLLWAEIELESTLRDAIRIFSRVKSLFTLDPIRRRMESQVDSSAIEAAAIPLRLISVALEDGDVRVVDQDGDVTRVNSAVLPEHRSRSTTSALIGSSLSDKLIRGAIASSAIPGVFEAEVLVTSDGHRSTCVDGGVREVLPVREAIDMSEEFANPGVIAISAGNVGNLVGSHIMSGDLRDVFDEAADFSDASIASVMERGIEAAVDEVALGDLEKLHEAGIPLLDIRPIFKLGDAYTIDPGLIQISIAYGFMCAFDAWRKLGGMSVDLHQQLALTTHLLAQKRHACWVLEQRFERQHLPDPDDPFHRPALFPIFEQGVIERIRRLKVETFGLARFRTARFGTPSVPTSAQISAADGHTNTVSDWWREWELHANNLKSPYKAYGFVTASPFNRDGTSPWSGTIWEFDSSGEPATVAPADPPPALPLP